MNKTKDMDYWLKRYAECFPATYPPELYTTETREYLYRTGFLWIKPIYRTYEKAICSRCGKELWTGHMCNDIGIHISLHRDKFLEMVR